jgi:hypothetical protein
VVAQKTLRKPIQDTFVIWHAITRRSPELISYEEVTGWLYHLIKERQLSASSVNIAVSARALSLRRDTWARDARPDGIGPAHEARHPARGGLRAQRGRSDLDGAQTAAGPGALDDGL